MIDVMLISNFVDYRPYVIIDYICDSMGVSIICFNDNFSRVHIGFGDFVDFHMGPSLSCSSCTR